MLPPQPWINVIANRSFGFVVSETGGGFTWADNSQSNRLTPWRNDPVGDKPGEVVYLRDGETGAFWSATPQPCGTGAAFLVRHGQGYTTFEHERDRLECKLTVFIAPEEPITFFRLTVRNTGSQWRRLSAFYYAELVLGTHRSRTAAHVVTEIDTTTEALLARTSWDADFKDKITFVDVDPRPRSVTTDRTEFIGRDRTLANLLACVRGQLAGTVGACVDPCAALQTSFILQAGEEKTLVFVLGQAATMDEVRRLIAIGRDAQKVQACYDATRDFWDRFTTGLTIRTPDAALDMLVNRWLPC